MDARFAIISVALAGLIAGCRSTGTVDAAWDVEASDEVAASQQTHTLSHPSDVEQEPQISTPNP